MYSRKIKFDYNKEKHAALIFQCRQITYKKERTRSFIVMEKVIGKVAKLVS